MTAADSTCLIAFGANQGDREQMLGRALLQLGEQGFRECLASRLYRTRPIGGPAGQGEYVNAVIRARCSGSAAELVQRLLGVETALGRKRSERWAPRTIDLDLLLLDEQSIDQSGVHIPHPRMTCRRFVLEPACEIAPELRHPWSGASLRELFQAVAGAVPRTAVWLWPTEVRESAESRLGPIRQGLNQRGVAAHIQWFDPGTVQSFERGKQPGAGASGVWRILLVQEPLQLKEFPFSPGLVIGWALASPMKTEYKLAREAVLKHVGAVTLLSTDLEEAVRELTAVLQGVEEFWHSTEAASDSP